MKSLVRLCAIACALGSLASGALASCMSFQPQSNSNITANGDGTFHYEVNSLGQSGCRTPVQLSVVDFYLPYFSDMGLTNITESAVWTHTIEVNNDLFGIGGGVLHFHAANTLQFLSFFEFQANYSGIKGPFQNTLYNVSTAEITQFVGDPLIPASPMTVAALSAVPEPSSVALLLAAFGILRVATRKRRA